MPLVVKDRVKQFSVTAGTGTLTLGAAPNGFQSFDAIGDGNTTFYAIVDAAAGDWEVGVGTYSSTGGTLSRDSVLASSNADNLVNFGSASKEVFAVYPADKAVFTDVIQTLTNKTISGADNTITNIPNSATTATSANTASTIVARDASGNFSAGTITGALTGNASTATALQTARTIGGVSFDGTANINLPGVNQAGNQNTSGNAASATVLQTARTIGGVSFNGSANINLPGVNQAGNQNTTGTAANVTGTVAIANGGTGQTTAGAAINALLPAQAGNNGRFLTTNGTNPSWSFVPDPIPSGTKMMFVQTTAPTGWTKDTTHDNKALRVVSGTAGSGGSVTFTTAFASQNINGTIGSTTATNQNTTAGGTNSNTTATNNNTTATNQNATQGGTVGAHTLTVAQMPSHTHTARWSNFTGGNNMFPQMRTAGNQTTPNASLNTGGSGSHSHTFTGTAHTHTQDAHTHTQNAHTHTFTGTAHTHTQDAHTHTFTGSAVNLAVQYVDVIIATKD